jgi:glycosyltransferase involved in cell wall biosynthesis
LQEKKPLVSILIANYNNGVYIENAIKSIVNQTYLNWEIIIVDDDSTDNSWEIITKFAETYPYIRCYQNPKNLKVGATKARATSLAKGQICAILDPDDKLVPTAIEKQVQCHLEYSNCSMVSSKYYICDEVFKINGINTDVYKPEQNYSYLASKGGINAFWSFKKSKYDLTRGFKTKYYLAEDQDLYYQLEEVGAVKVINEPLYYYRIHKNSISKNDNLAKAYAYHLLAMFEAKNRRPKNKLESEAIEKAFVHFMTWGIMKIKKPLRLQLLSKMTLNFPNLLYRKSVFSAIYGLSKN